MTTTNEQKQSEFQVSEKYERLIRMRSSNPQGFNEHVGRSIADRITLETYEKQKAAYEYGLKGAQK